jgi:hypothetical protein
MAWQAVVRDRLPHRGGAHPRTDRRPDPWVAVECAHAHADPLRMLVVAREDGRAAATAEPLLTPVLGVPAFQDVVTGNDAERFNRSVGARRCGGTRSTLAATAVAVARAEQLGRHLVSHRAAVAASRYRKRRHGSHCRGFDHGRSSAACAEAEVAPRRRARRVLSGVQATGRLLVYLAGARALCEVRAPTPTRQQSAAVVAGGTLPPRHCAAAFALARRGGGRSALVGCRWWRRYFHSFDELVDPDDAR